MSFKDGHMLYQPIVDLCIRKLCANTRFNVVETQHMRVCSINSMFKLFFSSINFIFYYYVSCIFSILYFLLLLKIMARHTCFACFLGQYY